MINSLRNRIAWLSITAAVVSAFGEITPGVLAQDNQTPGANGEKVEPSPAIQNDRAYETDRHKSLSRHKRFDRSDIPPGYSPFTWYQEMASTNAYDRGYEEGFRHGWQAALQAAAEDHNESFVTSLMAEGGKHFREGNYGSAARSFLLAAQMNQGDPGSRLQAAHAAVALGRYHEAFPLVRRAFQLQPKLAYLALDIRREYDDQAEFQKHLQSLEKDALKADDDPRLWALLGYYRFFSDRHEEAYQALERAVSLDPGNRFANHLLQVARISVPASDSTR